MNEAEVSTESRVSKELARLAGKHLTFELGDEVYGIEILQVQEIIGMMTVTRVPRTPGYVRGVINLRGKVIPVIDLRKKFQMKSVEDTERTCIIVVQISASGNLITMGIVVDEVSEVIAIHEDQLEPAPTFGTNVATDFILAMGKIGERVVILLDVDKVLTVEEIGTIARIAAE